jgi:hypothetical protein
MRYVFLIVTALFGLAGNASAASSLYLTTSRPLSGVRCTSNDYYTFLAPYFAQVRTRVSISISKVSNQSNQMGGQPGPTTKQASSPSSPTISLATWDAGQAIFAISCDLSSVLTSKNTITVDGVNQNAFNRDYTVDTVGTSTVKATPIAAPPANPAPGQNGTIKSINCPAPAGTTSNPSLSVQIGVTPMPYGRAYLYLRKDAFYADTVNVGVGADGMLTSSDTSSQQEITAILTELAQTVGQFATGFGLAEEIELIPGKQPERKQPDARKQCFQALNDLVQFGPFYKEYIIDGRIAAKGHYQE